MSYGRFVQASIDERRDRHVDGRGWLFAAEKFANDNFQDFPEEHVVDVLRGMRWPDRPVSVREVLRVLRSRHVV